MANAVWQGISVGAKVISVLAAEWERLQGRPCCARCETGGDPTTPEDNKRAADAGRAGANVSEQGWVVNTHWHRRKQGEIPVCDLRSGNRNPLKVRSPSSGHVSGPRAGDLRTGTRALLQLQL